jgi:hypothetical protein
MLIMIRGGSLDPPTVHHHHRKAVVASAAHGVHVHSVFFTQLSIDPIHASLASLYGRNSPTNSQTQKVYAVCTVCMPRQSKVFLSEPTWESRALRSRHPVMLSTILDSIRSILCRITELWIYETNIQD